MLNLALNYEINITTAYQLNSESLEEYYNLKKMQIPRGLHRVRSSTKYLRKFTKSNKVDLPQNI